MRALSLNYLLLQNRLPGQYACRKAPPTPMEGSGPHDLPYRTLETENPRSFASPLFAKFEVFLFLPPPRKGEFLRGLWIVDRWASRLFASLAFKRTVHQLS